MARVLTRILLHARVVVDRELHQKRSMQAKTRSHGAKDLNERQCLKKIEFQRCRLTLMYTIKTMKSYKMQVNVLLDRWHYNRFVEVEQAD